MAAVQRLKSGCQGQMASPGTRSARYGIASGPTKISAPADCTRFGATLGSLLK